MTDDPLRIHADFSHRAVVDTNGQSWIASPSSGVERKMLDRVGGEVARATSIVRYQPGSRFPEHTHGGGEAPVSIDSSTAAFTPGLVDGLTVCPLHQHKTESTALVRWQPGTHFNRHTHFGGEEIYVIEGVFEDEQGVYPAGTWLRNPHGSAHTPFSNAGCLIYVKVGHLLEENGTLSDPGARTRTARSSA